LTQAVDCGHPVVGQVYKIKFPKFLDRLNEEAIQEHCDIQSAQDYVRANGNHISGTVVQVIDNVSPHTEFVRRGYKEGHTEKRTHDSLDISFSGQDSEEDESKKTKRESSIDDFGESIFIELRGGSQAKVKLLKLTPREHGLTDVQVGQELVNHQIQVNTATRSNTPNLESRARRSNGSTSQFASGNDEPITSSVKTKRWSR
jgi:hypothetical protein